MFKSKIIEKQIWSEIDNSSQILLHFHPSPDGDSVGSALAMMHVLKNMGKKVTVIGGDSDYPQYLGTLPGFDQITPKNFFQTDLSQYDLFIVLDSSSKNQISKMGEVVFPQNLKTIIIDHHATNEKFADINLVEENSPATSQIIYSLLKNHKVKITPEIAACLFVGIYTDTGGFKYANTDWKTLDIASKLAKINPDYNKVIFELENNDNPDRLKFLSLILGNIENHFSGRVAIASLDFETIKKNSLNNQSISTSDVSNMLKAVTGWDIGICLVETQPNVNKLSFRTRDQEKYNLTKIGAALSGGGHAGAAGATINKPFAEAKKILIENLKSTYTDLG